MVRRHLTTAALAALALATLGFAACERQEEMAESVDMADTTALHQAIQESRRRAALLDTMPGGEMAIGDSAAEMELLEDKMPGSVAP